MARIKHTPRKPPGYGLIPRTYPPTRMQVRDDSGSQKRSNKEETKPTSSQGQQHPATMNNAEKEHTGPDEKGKMPAVESHTNDEVQQEIVVEEEQEQDAAAKTEEGDGDTHRKLIKELKAFRALGLMTKKNPREEEEEENEEEASSEDPCYGEEVKKKYPRFFYFIPQNPHYQGLLLDGFGDGIKKTVYQALWYNLVDLMERALQTNFFSSRRDMEEMKQQAMGLEKLGFDVRHVKARLEQPTRSIYDLNDARNRLNLAKKRKRDMEEKIAEIEMLEAKAAKFKSMLSDVEAKISLLKAAVGSSDSEEQASTLKKLTKCVEDEEKNFHETLDSCKAFD